MKCPKCDGTGEMQICEMGFIGKDECDKCHGKGYLTNDEWRKTCSAEEFAEFLCNVGFENETIVRKFRSEWVKWLKEKHDGSV